MLDVVKKKTLKEKFGLTPTRGRSELPFEITRILNICSREYQHILKMGEMELNNGTQRFSE